MKLYFGNMVTTVTTLMILSLVGFVGYSISNRGDINFWGRRSLFVLAYGLIICCFAAARDGLDKTIQYTIDGSCNPGIFSLVSVLCDVWWSDAKDCSYGDCKNCTDVTLYVKDLKMKAFERTKTWLQAKNIYNLY